MVELTNAEKIIEIGVFTGYSSCDALTDDREVMMAIFVSIVASRRRRYGCGEKVLKAAQVHTVREHVGDAKASVTHEKVWR